ncbi:hypothetical protein A8H39_14860 [Paraburkholderia fungorum]|nr:hypothetical protein A8H39_14860 [Paraburkholderia fungorum]
MALFVGNGAAREKRAARIRDKRRCEVRHYTDPARRPMQGLLPRGNRVPSRSFGLRRGVLATGAKAVRQVPAPARTSAWMPAPGGGADPETDRPRTA